MAVGYRSSSASGTGDAQTAGPVNVPVPAGAASGDIAILCAEIWLDTATDPVVTWPAGFTQILQYESTTDGFQRIALAWKRLTAADTGNYAYNLNSSYWTMGHCILITGAAATGDPIEATNTAQNSGTSLPSTSVTTVTQPFLAHFIANENNATKTPPTNFTEVQDGNYLETAYRIPGTTGTHTTSGGSTSASTLKLAVLVAVKADGGGSGATATPAAISTAVAVPQATPSVSDTAAPSAIAGAVSVPQATPSVSDTAAPAGTAVVVAVPQATARGNATVTPATISATVAVPQAAPVTAGNATAAPSTITAIATLPQASPSGSAIRNPAAIGTAVAVPQATPNTAGNATATPARIAAAVALPQATPHGAAVAVPARIQAVSSLPAAVPAVHDTATPAAIQVVTAFPQPTPHGAATANPATILLLVQLYTVTAGGPPPPFIAVLVPIAMTRRQDGTAVTRDQDGTAITGGGHMKTGDREPDWVVDISDALAGGNLNTVVSWRFVASLNGVIVFTDTSPAVVVDATNTYEASVTHTWVAGETDDPGTLRAEVVAVWPGGREQTFPGKGQATITIERGLD